MRRLSRIAVFAVALLVALAAACGGGGDKKNATSTPAGATGDATAVATRAGASPTAARSTPTAATSRTAVATGVPRSSSTVGALSPLDSYHYTVDIEFVITNSPNGVTGHIEGDYVAPGSHSFVQTFEVAGIKGNESTVIIGDDAWQKQTSGDWIATKANNPAVVGSLDLTSADPTFFADPKFVDDIKVFPAKDDTLDGRAARRYDVDREQFAQLGDTFGSDLLSSADLAGIDEFTMKVWVDEETEALVRAELVAKGDAAELLKDSNIPSQPGETASISLKLSITQINDESIKIEPPI